MSDRDVAQEFRREVEASGGSQWVAVRTLRNSFGRSTLTRRARREIATALRDTGVLTEPDLEDVALNDEVQLYLAERDLDPEFEDLLGPPAPTPEWTPPPPPPPPPSPWQRFRRWPAWAQLASAAAVLVVIVAIAGGGEDGGGDRDLPPAQQAGAPETVEEDRTADEAEERERARERRRERARRKRERARERERIRERRREREEARERRRREREQERQEREQEQEEEAAQEGDCEPGYSPCVPSYPPDLDCPDVGGPVAVTGSDPHRLDADNDGEGCE